MDKIEIKLVIGLLITKIKKETIKFYFMYIRNNFTKIFCFKIIIIIIIIFMK
jgi:hypothetical protein